MENNFEQISKVSGFMKHNGGLLFRDLSETEFEFKSTIQKIHLNRRDITHGGFICSIADTGMGNSAHKAAQDKRCVTISLDVKFISAASLGEKLLGKVKIQKKTRTLVFVTCEISNSKNILATASGVWKIL